VTSPKASARNERLAWQAKPVCCARDERLAWQAKPVSSREDVDLDAVADELLGELAHVAGEASLHDRGVLPAEDQDAHGAHGADGHYR
jgi:hypothetical protein